MDTEIDTCSDDYVSFLKKVASVSSRRVHPSQRQQRFVKFEDRLEKSDLTKEDIIQQANGRNLMKWRGTTILKSPLDYCIYQLMLQEIKPAAIIEIGTFTGGSAAWMADLMKIHDVQTHVYSMDIDFSYLDPTVKERNDITFIKGDSNKIEDAFPENMLKGLPHPWLITEDSHVNIPGLLAYFHNFTHPGDYIVVEDTHPLINSRLGFGLFKDIEYEAVGTSWVYDPFKEFMKSTLGSHYRVDTGYTDLYGCLVDEYSYHLGMLGPAIGIILVLGFMRKRVKLQLDLCNSRPGLPVPVDFLGKDRNRVATVLAFGATSAMCFTMFFDTINPGSTGMTAASKNIPKTPWSKAFQGIVMTLLFGIINYPYLACLHTEYKVLGYTIGLVYIFIRMIVDLFLYCGCSVDDATRRRLQQLGISYLLYNKFIMNLPSVICTILLVGCYTVLLYKELRTCYTNNTGGVQFQDILNPVTNIDEHVAEETDRNHVVLLLLANKLHKKRVQQQCEPCYVTLKHRIYESRPDFKFSTQFLSAVLVSFIFVYEFTLLIIMVIPLLKIRPRFKSSQQETMLLDYVVVAVIMGCVIAVLQLAFFMRSHRGDVLRTYKSKKHLLPDEFLQPKMLVGKCLRFCGYQIAFTAIGFVFVSFALFIALLVVWAFKVSDMLYGREYVLNVVRQIVLAVLPLIFVPVFIWFVLILMCKFVFFDKTFPDLTVHIDNRRLYDIMSYFFFFLNILVGLWSGLLRVGKGALLGLVFLCRLDRTSMMTGYRKFDAGYVAYIGFLNVLVAYRHPVMLCFCQLLIDGKNSKYSGKRLQSLDARPRVSSKSLNRWFLAVMLIRNPSLVRYRRQEMFTDVVMKPYYSPTDLTSIVMEESPMLVEHLKSVNIY